MSETGVIARIRPFRESDSATVATDWLKSFHLSHYAGPIPMDLYWPTYRTIVNRLMWSPRVTVLMACSPTDDAQTFGWIACERKIQPLIHFIYVKQVFRHQGIAKMLMAAADISTAFTFIYTFKTPAAARLIKGQWGKTRIRPWAGVFDPLKARFAPPESP